MVREIEILFPLPLISPAKSSFDIALDLLPSLDFQYGDATGDFKSKIRQIRFYQFMAGADLAVKGELPMEFFLGVNGGFRVETYWDMVADTLETITAPVVQPEVGIRTMATPLFPNSGIISPNTLYGLSLEYGAEFILSTKTRVDFQHKLSLGLNLWCDF